MRRQDSICMTYVASTVRAAAAIHAGVTVSATWSERNSDQLCAIERVTKVTTASVTRPCAAQSHRRACVSSGLDELVADRPREHPPGPRHRRIEVRAAPIHQAESVHLAQAPDRLTRPAVDKTLQVRDAAPETEELLHF